jgi:hypothetical protein
MVNLPATLNTINEYWSDEWTATFTDNLLTVFRNGIAIMVCDSDGRISILDDSCSVSETDAFEWALHCPVNS